MAAFEAGADRGGADRANADGRWGMVCAACCRYQVRRRQGGAARCL